jgi:hypothetical protein
MNGDPMDSKVRCDFGGDNRGERYGYLSSCTPDLQVISAVNNLIGDTEKACFLQEINPKPDENAKWNYVYDGLAEDAPVNDSRRRHGRDERRRTQPNPAFVQDRIFERNYSHS